jgi:hypothetical protein
MNTGLWQKRHLKRLYGLDYDVYQVTLPYFATWTAPRSNIDEAHLKPRCAAKECDCCGTYPSADGYLSVAYLCPFHKSRGFINLLESIHYVVCFDAAYLIAVRIPVEKLCMVMADGNLLPP